MKKYNNINNHYFYCDYPDECPICHSKISPNKVDAKYNDKINLISFLFECPSCGKGFVSHYNYDSENRNKVVYGSAGYDEIVLIDSFPKIPKTHTFDETIENLSKNFCEIYNQALAAETYNLNQISGIGYRKALEFLIKDYCIYRNPDKESSIKEATLGQTIENYIDSTKIKNLAKASTWLGNDETHYVKKYADKDIKDLKNFINATVYFISYDLLSDVADDIIESK